MHTRQRAEGGLVPGRVQAPGCSVAKGFTLSYLYPRPTIIVVSKITYVIQNRPSEIAIELMLHTPIAVSKEHTRLREQESNNQGYVTAPSSVPLCRGRLRSPNVVILFPS